MDTGGGHTNGGHVEITAKDIKKHISEANIRKTGTLMLNGLQLTAIPVELIGKCAPYVHSFTIIHNNITHIPKGILPQFTKLRVLDLSLNKIQDLPEDICQLSHLEQLFILQNNITHLPASMCTMNSLKTIALSGNDLEEIPHEVFTFHQIEVLYLNYNRLTKIPEGLFQMKNLKKVSFGFNFLKKVPRNILAMENLEELFLKCNKISCLPGELMFHTSLKNVPFVGNHLLKLRVNERILWHSSKYKEEQSFLAVKRLLKPAKFFAKKGKEEQLEITVKEKEELDREFLQSVQVYWKKDKQTSSEPEEPDHILLGNGDQQTDYFQKMKRRPYFTFSPPSLRELCLRVVHRHTNTPLTLTLPMELMEIMTNPGRCTICNQHYFEGCWQLLAGVSAGFESGCPFVVLHFHLCSPTCVLAAMHKLDTTVGLPFKT